MDATTRENLTAAATTVVEENADTIIETIREGLEPVVAKFATLCNVTNIPEVVITLDTAVTDDGNVIINYLPRLVFAPTQDTFEEANNYLLNLMWVEAMKTLA